MRKAPGTWSGPAVQAVERDPTAWLARALRAHDMPLDEVRAVLATDDPIIVRRYFELHRERLAELLTDQLLELASLERILAARSMFARGKRSPTSALYRPSEDGRKIHHGASSGSR